MNSLKMNIVEDYKERLRFLNGESLKIGLALGSGAARGLAHIGILKALKEEGISIDMIAGSSMGALVGACYARKEEITDLEEIVLKTDWRQLVRLVDPNLALIFKGVIHGKKVEELLRILIGDVEFKDLKIQLAVVATDVDTGEEIIIREGSVVEAIRASISMPAIFMPVKFSARGGSTSGRKDRFLIDGGIVNPLPVSVLRDLGATFIIACNVIPDPLRRRSVSSTRRYIRLQRVSKPQTKNEILATLNNKIKKLIQSNRDKVKSLQKFTDAFKAKVYRKSQNIDPGTPNIFDALIGTIYTMEYEIAKLKAKGADVLVNPEVADVGVLEFHRGKEVISAGYKAIKDIIPTLQILNRERSTRLSR